jgi:hypothetical protein
MAVVTDRIEQETSYRSEGKDGTGSINFVRADGFGAIVNLLVGHDALPNLSISKSSQHSFTS